VPSAFDAHGEAQLLLSNFFDNILELQEIYGPDLVTIHDATDMFPILAKSSSSSSCPFSYGGATTAHCFTPIITIYDRVSNSLEELHEQSIPLPHVLLLSGLDNSVQEMDLMGPSSIYATLQLWLECAFCESLSPWVVLNETSEAIQCREKLQQQGINDSLRKWMARLVVTRQIVAVPVADVTGFYYRLVDELTQGDTTQTEQYDNGAGCDFPFPMNWLRENSNTESSNSCMNTYPAQIINELFHSHAFQLGVAFHGSTDASIGRIEIPKWTEITSDQEAMTEIGIAMSAFGSGPGSLPYNVSATDIVESEESNKCTGAKIESWAFSAGYFGVWLEQCSCDSSSSEDAVCDYSSDRTRSYAGSPLRSFIARAVAPPLLDIDIFCLPGFDRSTIKSCCSNSDQHNVFDSTPFGTNVRMSLIAADLVQPWASIHSVDGVELRDDIVPKSPRMPESCTHTKAMKLPESSYTNNVTVTWSVGGALEVAETAVLYGEWKVLDKKIFNCVTRPTKQELDAFFSVLRDFEEMEGETEEQMETEVTFTPIQSGKTRWHSSNHGSNVVEPETTFSVTLDLSRYKVGDVIAIYALARVDQNWGHFEGETSSGSTPQSNIVNARTNPEWIISQNEVDIIKGQLDFFSVPVTIEIENRPGFFEGTDIKDSSIRLSDATLINEQMDEDGIIVYALFMAVLTILIVFVCAFCREQSDGTDIFSVISARRKIMHVSKLEYSSLLMRKA
jgi:hypothetical protein